MRLYVKQVDSIRKLTETESLRKMHALYNRERMELFQEKLKRENIQLRYEIGIISILFTNGYDWWRSDNRYCSKET